MIFACLILGLFFSCLAAMLYDIDCSIHEALLDDLWSEDEDVSASWSAEASVG